VITIIPFSIKTFILILFFGNYIKLFEYFINVPKFWHAAILVYRMAAGCSTSCRGTYVKLTHGLLHLATVPCVVLGAVAAMEYHRLKGLPHLYSLHSWMGLLTVSLFVIQVLTIIHVYTTLYLIHISHTTSTD